MIPTVTTENGTRSLAYLGLHCSLLHNWRYEGNEVPNPLVSGCVFPPWIDEPGIGKLQVTRLFFWGSGGP